MLLPAMFIFEGNNPGTEVDVRVDAKRDLLEFKLNVAEKGARYFSLSRDEVEAFRSVECRDIIIRQFEGAIGESKT